MIRLHYYPATAAMIPHIVLEEIGVPYERVFIDRPGDEHKRPPYLAMNPNGTIPVLEDGTLVLYETAAICLHLCDAHPQAKLAPATGTPERAHFYKWMAWMTNTLQATLMVFFYPERWAPQGDAQAQAAVKSVAERRVAPLLAQLDAQLASHGQPWLLGAGYSAADAYAFTLCRWTRNFAQEKPARTYPQLAPYLQRMLDRAAVRRVFAVEEIQPPFV